MGLARAGDLASFNALVERHQGVVFAVCYRLLGERAAAEDATQDTFVRAWRAIDGWHGGLVRPWFLRIATNRCYDLLRVQKRRPTISLDEVMEGGEPGWAGRRQEDDPEGLAVRSELNARLERSLATLPLDQRVAITLVDIQGLSYEEASQATGAAVGTIKSRISRGRARLRDDLRLDDATMEHLYPGGRLSGGDDAAPRVGKAPTEMGA